SPTRELLDAIPLDRSAGLLCRADGHRDVDRPDEAVEDMERLGGMGGERDDFLFGAEREDRLTEDLPGPAPSPEIERRQVVRAFAPVSQGAVKFDRETGKRFVDQDDLVVVAPLGWGDSGPRSRLQARDNGGDRPPGTSE